MCIYTYIYIYIHAYVLVARRTRVRQRQTLLLLRQRSTNTSRTQAEHRPNRVCRTAFSEFRPNTSDCRTQAALAEPRLPYTVRTQRRTQAELRSPATKARTLWEAEEIGLQLALLQRGAEGTLAWLSHPFRPFFRFPFRRCTVLSLRSF